MTQLIRLIGSEGVSWGAEALRLLEELKETADPRELNLMYCEVLLAMAHRSTDIPSKVQFMEMVVEVGEFPLHLALAHVSLAAGEDKFHALRAFAAAERGIFQHCFSEETLEQYLGVIAESCAILGEEEKFLATARNSESCWGLTWRDDQEEPSAICASEQNVPYVLDESKIEAALRKSRQVRATLMIQRHARTWMKTKRKNALDMLGAGIRTFQVSRVLPERQAALTVIEVCRGWTRGKRHLSVMAILAVKCRNRAARAIQYAFYFFKHKQLNRLVARIQAKVRGWLAKKQVRRAKERAAVISRKIFWTGERLVIKEFHFFRA